MFLTSRNHESSFYAVGRLWEASGSLGETLGSFGKAFGELRKDFGRLWANFGKLRGSFGELREGFERLWETVGTKASPPPTFSSSPIYKNIQTPDQPRRGPILSSKL